MKKELNNQIINGLKRLSFTPRKKKNIENLRARGTCGLQGLCRIK